MSTSDRKTVDTIRDAFPPLVIDFAKATTGGLDGGAYRDHVDGKRWTSVDAAYLVNHNDALSFLDAHHIAAVLPVYLTSLVVDGVRTSVPDTLLLVLNRTSEARFAALFDVLSPPQRRAIVASLDAFAAQQEGTLAEAARGASIRWSEQISKKEGV